MSPTSVRQRQIEAAARAMWERDWGEHAVGDREPGAPRLPYTSWDREMSSVRASYRDLAKRALQAAAGARAA